MSELIKAINISYRYEGKSENAIDQISFGLNSGESLGILGPNGGGKTTLMKILSGLIPHFQGELFLFGKNVQSNFPYKEISYVPQTSQLNMALPLRAIDYLNYAAEAINIKNAQQKILQLAKQVGIENKLEFFMRDMSGGEKQRVLIAKALLNSPQILLLDEPTKGLDSLGQDQLLLIIKEIKENHQTAIVIVDHNINQIIRHCDKVLCLNKNSHWHDHKDLLTKNVLENIYHCEFEHLLIHENESNHQGDSHTQHLFCDHHDEKSGHHLVLDQSKKHKFIWRKK